MSLPINDRFMSTRVLFPTAPAAEPTPAPAAVPSSSNSLYSALYCDEDISNNPLLTRKRERRNDAENGLAPKVQRTVARSLPSVEERQCRRFQLSDRTELRRQAISKLYADKLNKITPVFENLFAAVNLLHGEIERQMPPSTHALRFLRAGCSALKGNECEARLLEATEQLQEASIKLRYPCSEEEILAAIALRDRGLASVEAVLKRVQEVKGGALVIAEDTFLNAKNPGVLSGNSP